VTGVQTSALPILYVGVDLLLADVGDRAGDLRVADGSAVGEDAGSRVLIGLAEEGAVAAVGEAGEADVARLGADGFLVCPTILVGHGQATQAGEAVVPPCAVVHGAAGDEIGRAHV